VRLLVFLEHSEAIASMPHVHTLASALAGAAMAIWIGWILLTVVRRWKRRSLRCDDCTSDC
jgi:hypothetical protein